MRKIVLFLIFVMPVTVFGQKQNQGVIDSMIQELPKFSYNKSGAAFLLSNIAFEYGAENDHNHALEYYLKSLKLYEQLGNKNQLARIYGNIGSTYLSIAQDTSGAEGKVKAAQAQNANLYKAADYLGRCVALCRENGFTDVLETFSKDQAAAQYAIDYYQAQQRKHVDLKDKDTYVKISNAETRAVPVIRVQQREIAKANAENKVKEWSSFIVILVVMLIVSIAMYTIYRRQKANSKLVAEEQRKSEELLLNILPAQVAEELKQKGMTHAQQYDDVTVLITDFVAFTTVAERFSPKQLVGELHACFKAFDGMLEKYNIEKIKTVGDAYLAVSGLPVGNPNHASDMIATAIMMRDFMNYRRTQLGDATFEMRIGVHSGSVIAGIVGVKKFAYDIWGDTVNLAARMEQNSEPGKINISQSTYELIKDKYHCEYRGEIMAKKKGKLKMYFVHNKL